MLSTNALTNVVERNHRGSGGFLKHGVLRREERGPGGHQRRVREVESYREAPWEWEPGRRFG